MSAPLVENPANVHPSSGLSDDGLPAVVCSVQTTQTVSAVIKLGKAAQRRLDLKARDVWQDWVAVCLALWAIMMQALAEAGTDAPHGGKYHKAIRRRLRLHGFERYKNKTTRSIMVAVARNIAAIEVWRGTLPPERLAELNHPRVVLDHWRRSLGAGALKYKRANPITATWQRSSRQQRTAGLGGIPFDDFRICMPPEWHAGMVAAARRLVDRLRDPDARLTQAIQDALTSISVADAPCTSAPVREAHKLAALTSLRQALIAMRSVKRAIREVDVGLAVAAPADIVCARRAA